jgi:hypothetical protein
MTPRLPLAYAIALLAPLCITTATLAWVAVNERVGATAFAGTVPRNSAEAAALGNPGAVLRFLQAGENPHDVHPLRASVISAEVLRATTLEAAMWSREVTMIRLLDREGAITDDAERRALACLAADLGVDDVVMFLAPEGPGHCEPGAAAAAVVARTSGVEMTHE